MMNIAAMLTDSPIESGRDRGTREATRPLHPYPTRHGSSIQVASDHHHKHMAQTHANAVLNHPSRTQGAPANDMVHADTSVVKTVTFRIPLGLHHRERSTLRVNIARHDTVESIVMTVKSFWGLRDGQGVNFQDAQGNVLIAQYDNLRAGEVYDISISNEDFSGSHAMYPHGQNVLHPFNGRTQLAEPFHMSSIYTQSRPASRSTRRRDVSPPAALSSRSGSYRPGQKGRPFDGDHSDSDSGSVSSSRRAKSEQVKADISLENIVEGGRRKLANFDSSELPLYAPPLQPVPASMSSLSPQRRETHGNFQSPVNMNPHATFSYNYQPLSYTPHVNNYNGLMTPNTGSLGSGYAQGPYQPNGHQLRTSTSRVPLRSSGASGAYVLPTPDPTINSVISDEDVALQLMRLGDASNWSHGRTSASTDDAVSGKAELASSEDATDVEGSHQPRPLPTKKRNHASVGPARKKLKSSNAVPQITGEYTSGEEYEDGNDRSFNGNSDPIGPNAFDAHNKSQLKTKSKPRTNSITSKSRTGKPKSKPYGPKIPPSPYSQEDESRKNSNASIPITQLSGVDDEDLSTKPRCQRCRKSKKGCDRQRPCQRCKDAGIGADGCVSEDEGNGRKGRFGRHMGVAVGKDVVGPPPPFNQSLAPAPTAVYHSGSETANGDNSKKRKR